ncbi:MAG: hypothetical protein GX605_14280, partial [Chloroflexi bacterium]|nr:hypothetical protein [Chloroflexota bacterium]
APDQTPTPAPTFDLRSLGDSFCYGAGVALAIFVGLGALAAFRGALLALWKRIRRR